MSKTPIKPAAFVLRRMTLIIFLVSVVGMNAVPVITSNAAEFTLNLAKGLNFISLPLKDNRISTLSDLAEVIGVELAYITYYNGERLIAYRPAFPEEAPANTEIEGGLGYFVQMKNPAAVQFTGNAWDGSLRLSEGINLAAAPVDDNRITRLDSLAEIIGDNLRLIIHYDVAEGKFYPFIPEATPVNSAANIEISGGLGFIVVMKSGIGAGYVVNFDGDAWPGGFPVLIPPTESPLALLTISGMVRDEDGIPIGADQLLVDAKITSPQGETRQMGQAKVAGETIKQDGYYQLVFLNTENQPVAQAGDMLAITVKRHDGTIASKIQRSVTADDIATAFIESDITLTRIAPQILALAFEAYEFSADSSAPRGIVRLEAFTEIHTTPGIETVSFDISSDGSKTWEMLDETLGGDDEGFSWYEDIAPERSPELGAKQLASPLLQPLYRRWILEWDTSKVDDTITHHPGLPPEADEGRNVASDDNPYILRAVAFTASGAVSQKDTPVEQIAVDNVDDVPPITGTEIALIEAQDDEGHFRPRQPNPDTGEFRLAAMARLTANPKAEAKTFSEVKLIISERRGDEIKHETAVMSFEKRDDGYSIGLNTKDFSNGEYSLFALALDDAGNLEVPDTQRAEKILIANIEHFDLSSFRLLESNENPRDIPLNAPPDLRPIGGRALIKVKAKNARLGELIISNKPVAQDACTVEECENLIFAKTTPNNNGDFLFVLDTDSHAAMGKGGRFFFTFRFRASPPEIPEGGANVEFIVDNNPPEIAFTTPRPGELIEPTRQISAKYAERESYLSEIHFRLENESGESVAAFEAAGKVDWSGETPRYIEPELDEEGISIGGQRLSLRPPEKLPPGKYSAKVRVIDLAGNNAATGLEFSIKDVRPPEITLITPQEPVNKTRTTLRIEFNDESKVNDVLFNVDGVDVPPEDVHLDDGWAEAQVENLPLGERKVTVSLADDAGNTANAAWVFTVEDNTPPEILAVSPRETVHNPKPILQVSAGDDIAGIDTMTITLSAESSAIAGKMTRGEDTATFQPESDLKTGRYSALASATDKSGNLARTSWDVLVSLPTQLSLPDLSASRQEEIIVPLKVPPDSGIASGEMIFIYDAQTLTFGSADTTELTSEFILNTTVEAPGKLIISLSQAGTFSHGIRPLAESGAIVKLTFKIDANAKIGSKNEMSLAGISLLTEWQAAIPAEGKNGAVTIIDVSKPVIDILSPRPEEIVNTATPTIIATYADADAEIASVKLILDEELIENVSVGEDRIALTPEKLSPGEHRLKLAVADVHDNVAEVEWSFSVENTPPAITSISPQDGATVPTFRPEIAVAYSDEGSGINDITFFIDGKDLTSEAQMSATRLEYVTSKDLPVGKHTAKLEISDKVGNVTAAEWSFMVERTVTLAVSDALKAPPESEFVVGISTDEATDVASFEFTLNYDYSQLLITGASRTDLTKDFNLDANFERKGRVAIVMTSSGEMLAGEGVICTVNGLVKKEAKFASTIILAIESVRVKTQDGVDFLLLLKPGSITITDDTPPTGRIAINSEAAFTNLRTVNLTLTAVDEGSGMGEMRFRNDDESFSAWQPFATNTSWILRNVDGQRVVSVQFRDVAQNASEIYRASILLDTTPPEGTITIQEGDSMTDGHEVILTISASDAGTGVSEMRLRNDNDSFSAWQSYQTRVVWGLTKQDGERTVAVQFRDVAQNVSAMYTDAIILDTTPPTVVSVTPKIDVIYAAINANIIINVSEDINPETLDEESLRVESETSGVIKGSRRVAAKRLVFEPEEIYPNKEKITVSISRNIKDMAGHSIEELTYAFTTGIAVYPGDANPDGRVNVLDIVPLGRYWLLNGEQRLAPITTAWTPQPAIPWDVEPGTHADTDGNGIVDAQDILPIAQNWQKTAVGSEARVAASSRSVFGEAHSEAGCSANDTLVICERMYEVLQNAPFVNQGVIALQEILRGMIKQLRQNPALPAETKLMPNYPNPFNPETWIPYQLSKEYDVQILIYNMQGQLVRILAPGRKTAGYYIDKSKAAYWNGRNDAGEKVPSGIYYYRFEAGEHSATRKLAIAK